MKRIALFIVAGIALLSLQNCKKSTTADTTVAATVYPLQASVNGVYWIPDTLSATITYTAASKTKTFSFNGTYLQKRLNCSVKLNSTDATNNFTLGTYPVDATGTTTMTYSIYQLVTAGTYAFVPVATAGAGDGNIAVTSIDTVNGLISGSFFFTTKTSTYDSKGNVISVTNTVVSGGDFTFLIYPGIANLF